MIRSNYKCIFRYKVIQDDKKLKKEESEDKKKASPQEGDG